MRRSAEQTGSAMVIAIIAVGLMLTTGLAAIAFGGGQRQLAAGERAREANFTLVEGVLNSQVFLLSRKWPVSLTTAYPSSCSSTTAVANCPDPATLATQFSNADYAGFTWTARVHDNGSPIADYYSPAGAASQPTYDANLDGVLWVRARAQRGSLRRTVVTQVKAQIKPIPLPKNTVTAGRFKACCGRKTLTDTNGRSYSASPGQPGTIAVRCSSPPQSSCLDYDPGRGQVSPPTYQTNYPAAPTVSADELEGMRTLAQANGTYYASGCPGGLSGMLVFIESGNCSYSAGISNTLSSPGAVVIVNGTLSMTGNATHYGLVYMANKQLSDGDVVTLSGCAKLIGSIFVEGQGGITAGNCGANIAFNGNYTGLLKAYVDPTVVKNTWREIAQ